MAIIKVEVPDLIAKKFENINVVNYKVFISSIEEKPTTTLKKQRIKENIKPILDIEIEPFSEEEIKSFGKYFLERTNKKLEKLLA